MEQQGFSLGKRMGARYTNLRRQLLNRNSLKPGLNVANFRARQKANLIPPLDSEPTARHHGIRLGQSRTVYDKRERRGLMFFADKYRKDIENQKTEKGLYADVNGKQVFTCPCNIPRFSNLGRGGGRFPLNN